MDEYNDCEIPITIIAKIQVTYYVFSVILFSWAKIAELELVLYW